MLKELLVSVFGGLIVLLIWRWWSSRTPKYHLDSAVTALVDFSLRLLPSDIRDEYRDIWWQHVLEQPTYQKRLIEALDLLRAGGRIASWSIITHYARRYFGRPALLADLWLLELSISMVTDAEIDELPEGPERSEFVKDREEAKLRIKAIRVILGRRK